MLPVKSPLPLFPPPPGITFVEDAGLKGAVATAANETAALRRARPTFRLAMIDLGGTGVLKWGGHDAQVMDYIASEAKIIALYAAFALRNLARRFAVMTVLGRLVGDVASLFGLNPPRSGAAPDLLTDLRLRLDPAIQSIADSRLNATKPEERLPRWDAMFTLPPNGIPDFTGPYRNALRAMVVPSSNPGAMTCIHGIGYAYLNGAVQAAGLFSGNTGPWLAGDFMRKYSYAPIDTVNDQGVAQAGTALAMAQLMAIISLEAVLLDGDSYTAMKALLHAAVTGEDVPFLTRGPPDFTSAALRIPRRTITHIKLGLGPLKGRNGGHNVASEVWRLEGLRKPGRVYAVAFQNLDWKRFQAEDIARMIRRTLELHEG